MIEAILFDLGNTLTQSASLPASLLAVANSPIAEQLALSEPQLSRIGREIEGEIGRLYETERLDQPHWRDLWGTGIRNGGLDLSPGQVELLCRAHLEAFLRDCRVAPYTIPLLESLQAKVPLGLVSNVTGPSEIFEHDLRKKGLRPYFQAVVWSSQVGVRKPNPLIFKLALEELALEAGPQVLMIGDNELADIAGGRGMGFTTIKVVREGTNTETLADYAVPGGDCRASWKRNFA